MSLHPATLLALVLCLGRTVNTQEGSLPSPFISAEPGLVIPRGSSVTIVCSNPDGYDTFRLEKNNAMYQDKKSTGPSVTEARFLLSPVNEATAGRYWCFYQKRSKWSQRSVTLELKVTDESVPSVPSPGATSGPPASQPQDHTIENLIRMVVAALLLIALAVLLLETCYNKKTTQDRTRK